MTTPKHILVTIPVSSSQKEKLESSAADSIFVYKPNNTCTTRDVQDANIIIGNVPPAKIQLSKNLEWIQLNSAGANQYVEKGVLASHTKLTNATGAYGLAVSEHMLAMTLSLVKKLPLYHGSQINHEWKDHGSVRSIEESTTLVIGLGDIGSEYAKKMNALGSSVIGIKRTSSSKPDYLKELASIQQLDELIPKADIIALFLPQTEETIHLFNAKRLNNLKKGALLLNAGRGNAIDTSALISMLSNEPYRIWAGLEVTDPEPLPGDHPLWETKGVVITPHISGQYHLAETLERIVTIASNNLAAFFSGKPLSNEVDFSTGYRKSK